MPLPPAVLRRRGGRPLSGIVVVSFSRSAHALLAKEHDTHGASADVVERGQWLLAHLVAFFVQPPLRFDAIAGMPLLGARLQAHWEVLEGLAFEPSHVRIHSSPEHVVHRELAITVHASSCFDWPCYLQANRLHRAEHCLDRRFFELCMRLKVWHCRRGAGGRRGGLSSLCSHVDRCRSRRHSRHPSGRIPWLKWLLRL